MKTVTITINTDGGSSIDLEGFHGKGCDKAMADFAGKDKPVKVTTKPEYREVVAETQKNKA